MLQGLNARFTEVVPHFSGEDFGALQGGAAVRWLGDKEVAELVRRAAEIMAGVAAGSRHHVGIAWSIRRAAHSRVPMLYHVVPEVKQYFDLLDAANAGVWVNV